MKLSRTKSHRGHFQILHRETVRITDFASFNREGWMGKMPGDKGKDTTGESVNALDTGFMKHGHSYAGAQVHGGIGDPGSDLGETGKLAPRMEERLKAWVLT